MLNKWQTHVVDATGDVIANATVAIKTHGTDTLADLFSDYEGTTPLTNPMTSSAGGYVECYMADGRYDIYINDVKIWEDFQVFSVSHLMEAVEKTAAYTLSEDDLGKVLEMNITGAGTITVPADTTTDFEIGTIFRAYNLSADPVTVSGEAGVTVHNEGEVPQYGNILLRKRAADEWTAEIPSAGGVDGIVFNMFDSVAMGDGSFTVDDTTPPVYQSAIIGGSAHTVGNTVGYSVVLGGNMATMQATVENCAILGGNMPKIEDYIDRSGILGGNMPTIEDYVADSAIIGGNTSVIRGHVDTCAVIGGDTNKITDYAIDCAILGGKECEIENSEKNGILGGRFNEIKHGPYGSAIVGGNYNTIGGEDGKNVIAAGQECFIKNGTHQFVTGYQNTVGSLQGYIYGAFVSGGNAHAYMPAQRAHANGRFSFNGDTQISDLVMSLETTDATEGYLSATAGYYYLPIYRAITWKFVIDVVARQVGGTAGTVGDSAMWRITGGIKNIGGELTRGTVSFSGAVADGDVINVGGANYYFRDNPKLESGYPTAQAGDAATAAASFAKVVRAHNLNVMDAVHDTGTNDVVISIFPEMETSSLSYPLTSTGSNISCDGGGTFGGTSEWSMGTNSFIGTAKGTGVPDADERDAGAAAWGATVSLGQWNAGLAINVTGEADKTIHWVAKVSLVEVG